MGYLLAMVIGIYAVCLFIGYILLGFYIIHYDLYVNSLKNGLWVSAIFIFLMGIIISHSVIKGLVKTSGGEYSFAKIIFGGLIRFECVVGFIIILLSFFWRTKPLLIGLSCGLLFTLTYWLITVIANQNEK